MRRLLLALFVSLLLCGAAIAAVNINTATKEELMTLKGVGEKRAQEIIDYRAKHGPFKSVDDLEKVPGIGPSVLKQIRSEVTTTGKTVIDKPAKAAKSKADTTKATPPADAKKSEPAKSGAAKTTKEKPAEPAKMEQKKAEKKQP